MSRSGRSFAALVLVGTAIGGWLALPLVLTFFPSAIAGVLRGFEEPLGVCRGILASVHSELPPFGAVALALTGVTLAPLCLRALVAWRPWVPRKRRKSIELPKRLATAATRVGIAGRVICLDDAARYAYCAGLITPRVGISTGALRCLRTEELEAVLWHEGHHLYRRDPMRSLAARVLRALFSPVPMFSSLVDGFELACELDADSAALVAQGTPRPLAGALLVLGDQPRLGALVSGWSLSSVRIDQLAGTRETELPRASRGALALSAAVLAVALVLAVGQAARAHLLPFGLLPEPAGPIAHMCPVPLSGPLL